MQIEDVLNVFANPSVWISLTIWLFWPDFSDHPHRGGCQHVAQIDAS